MCQDALPYLQMDDVVARRGVRDKGVGLALQDLLVHERLQDLDYHRTCGRALELCDLNFYVCQPPPLTQLVGRYAYGGMFSVCFSSSDKRQRKRRDFICTSSRHSFASGEVSLPSPC